MNGQSGANDEAPSRSGAFYEKFIAFSLSTLLINFQITYVAFAILYGLYLYDRYFVQKIKGWDYLTTLWSIPALFGLLMFAYHSVFTDLEGDYKRTLELILIFCFLVMVFDSVGYILKRFRPDVSNIFRNTIYLNFLIFLVLFFVRYVFDGFDLKNFYDTFEYRNLIVYINPNHADDVFFTLVLINLVSLLYLIVTGKATLPTFLCSLTVVAFCILFFFTLRSTGGVIGMLIGLGTGVIAIVVFGKPRLRWNMLAILGVVAISIIVLLNLHWIGFRAGHLVLLFGLQEFDQLRASICANVNADGYPLLGHEYADAQSIFFRLVIWSNAIDIWSQRPTLGHGVYNPEEFLSMYSGLQDCVLNKFAHVHSLYIDLLIRGGVVLLAFYGVVIPFVGFSIWNKIRDVGARHIQFVMLPFLVFFVYLVIENFFDLTFVGSNRIISCLFNVTAMWGIILYASKTGTEEMQL